MARSEGLSGGFLTQQSSTCSSCGGSGVQRTDASGYRTCLDCLGQGKLIQLKGQDLVNAALAERVNRGRPRPRLRKLNASTSAAK
jgi:DnaJ-class molecular chaperone